MAKIAILNDDHDFIRLMCSVLAESGHSANAAFQRRGAFEVLRREKPDLVLLDITFQDGDTGFNILTMLRLTRETRDIPVIICTARAPHEIEPVLAKASGDTVKVVYKPFDLDHLLQAVESALASRNHGRDSSGDGVLAAE